MKNSIFALFAREFVSFWHFEDFLVLSATWNDLFCSCVDDVSVWWQMFNFVFSRPKRWFQFNSTIVRTHFSSIMSLNNWKMIAETRSHIFRWRSRFRRRRVCLSSLTLPYYRRCKMAIFPLFKIVSFFNIGCFLSRFLHRITIYYSRDVFVCFWHLKIKTQKRPFLSILACYHLRKMANFATFQNRVILLTLSGFSSCFSYKTPPMSVCGHFLYYSCLSKFIPKVHFWRCCYTTALTKWPFQRSYFKLTNEYGMSLISYKKAAWHLDKSVQSNNYTRYYYCTTDMVLFTLFVLVDLYL